MSAISLLAIGCHTLGFPSRLHTPDIGLGIHVLVAHLDGDEVAALRPQVECAIAHVQQLTDLFRIEPSLFRLTLHGGVPFLLLCHDGALHDGLGKHLQVGGRDFQFHVRTLFDQTFYGDHKYQVLNFVMTICISSLTPPFRWLVKEKHRLSQGRGLTVQKYMRIETD